MMHVLWRRVAWVAMVVGALTASVARAQGRAPIDNRARDPYLGAIVVEAESGAVLFEDRADEPGYPASVIKLMDLLLVQEKMAAGQLGLGDPVTTTAQASRMGGSQVFLAEHEVFPVEDLLYALMIQSANDAAMALALYTGGTEENFVGMMNRRAAELGMSASEFHSVHGLPPSAGDKPDVSTARDLSVLARALLKHPDILNYTSTRERPFRNGQFIMRTHNGLLSTVEGCDGLKTGYFKAAGYSMAVTAKRGGRRLVCVVLGSPSRAIRDAKASELLASGFMKLPAIAPPPPPPPPRAVVVEAAAPEAPAEEPARRPSGWGRRLGKAALWVVGAIALVRIGMMLGRRRDPDLM